MFDMALKLNTPFICNADQLTGFYLIHIFMEKFFPSAIEIWILIPIIYAKKYTLNMTKFTSLKKIYTKIIITVHIHQFFGGAGFSTTVAKRKTVVQLGSLGRCCKPSPVKSKGETLEILACFAFCIAQNIAVLALRQGTLTKAYSRNQHF